MNILVTGANGQLGTELRAAAAGSGNHYVFSDVNAVPGRETLYLDITNIDAVRIIAESEHIDAILNCAGYTDVEKAEDDAAFADLLNHVAVANLAAVAKERGAVLVHLSSDYVFDGRSSVPYREDDVKNPTCAYGATKYAGECAVLESGCKYLIFRTAWMYSTHGRNFVRTIRRLASEREQVKVVFDQTGSPTSARELARFLVGVVDGGGLAKTGVYHYSGEGVCSWYDFALEIVALSGCRGRIVPCRTAEFPSKVHRPAYSVLDKSLVKKTFGIEIPHWKDSLRDCIRRMDAPSASDSK
ncbi:MAG: dTDP-4-dehydrorhamnose reductase [Bacteroidales bacterium]|jgi:dTDP-4-dehydrorhamnose reductase|nr:dTDP-4-dehydrorhamnose reductase [Bacteroidales bacterium]